MQGFRAGSAQSHEDPTDRQYRAESEEWMLSMEALKSTVLTGLHAFQKKRRKKLALSVCGPSAWVWGELLQARGSSWAILQAHERPGRGALETRWPVCCRA